MQRKPCACYHTHLLLGITMIEMSVLTLPGQTGFHGVRKTTDCLGLRHIFLINNSLRSPATPDRRAGVIVSTAGRVGSHVGVTDDTSSLTSCSPLYYPL